MNAAHTLKGSSETPEMLIAIKKMAKGVEVYHSVKTLCQKLSISRSTVERWVKEGKLPKPVLLNGENRFKDSEVDELILHQNPQRLATTKVAQDAANVIARL